jgi:tetratricopeptide (TPR) repeat protein
VKYHKPTSGFILWLVGALAGVLSPPAFAVPPDWEVKAQNAFDQGQYEVAYRLAQEALQEPAWTLKAHQFLGRILVKQQKWEESIPHFEAVNAGGRLSTDLKLDWIQALQNVKRDGEASALMESWLSTEPGQREVHFKLGELYLGQGKGQLALSHLEEARRLEMDEKLVVLPLARARFLANEDDQAVGLLEPAGRRLADPEILLGIGQLLFQHAYYRQAICPLRKAWQQQPGLYEVGMYLAISYFLIREFSESERIVKAIQPGLNPPLDYRILTGCVAARLGQWELAEKGLENARQQYPDRAEGYLNLGLFCLERGKLPQAKALLEKGSTLIVKGTKILYFIPPPENIQQLEPPREVRHVNIARGEFYCQLAEVLRNSRQEGAAFEVFRLALEVDNSSPRAYLGIGRLCFDWDKPDPARRFAERGLELSPAIPELHFLRGLIHQYSIQNVEAAENYKRAIELKGTKVPAVYWVQLGTAQLGQNPPKEAEGEASFLKALKVDATCAQAHYQLGRLYFNRGKFVESARWLEQAIRHDPNLMQAYFQYGQACLQNGEQEKGKRLLETFRRRRDLQENMQLCPDPDAPR